MNRTLRAVLLFVLIVCGTQFTNAQTTDKNPAPATENSSTNSTDDCLQGTMNSVNKAFKTEDSVAAAKSSTKLILKHFPIYACQFFIADSLRQQLMAQVEAKRVDKQPGATNNASGSTSLTSKGSAPSILGFALEHGGLSQTTNGNTVTFRGNLVNSITALLDSTYLGSYHLSQKDPIVRYLSKLSFGVSFDAGTNQSTSTQGFEPSAKNFSGFSAKYELYNHRDPRDERYFKVWSSSLPVRGPDPFKITDLDELITKAHEKEYEQWMTTVGNAIDALPDKPTNDQIVKLVHDAADSFRQFGDFPDVQAAIRAMASSMSDFLTAEEKEVDFIKKSSIWTVEYNFTRQLTSNNQPIMATQPNQKIPGLSNVNLVFEKGFHNADAPELTVNVGGTWFNSPDTADPSRGRVRDFRASVEADWSLTALKQVGQPVVSLSGEYLNLIAEPLGQKVTLNGVTIDRRGPMELIQGKVTIPLGKSSGVKIPISFTYASRTELIKETDVRGNIGFTFDLDTLFSRASH